MAFLSRCPHDRPTKSVPFRVPLILILTSGTAGCSAPIACPAIGWSNTAGRKSIRAGYSARPRRSQSALTASSSSQKWPS